MQSFLDSKVLNEPRGAANATWERFIAGETAEQIANIRDKPIQVTVVPTIYLHILGQETTHAHLPMVLLQLHLCCNLLLQSSSGDAIAKSTVLPVVQLYNI